MLCDMNNITALRLVLRQPSPVWKEFKIDDVVCYKTSISAQPDLNLPHWVTDHHKKTPGEIKV